VRAEESTLRLSKSTTSRRSTPSLRAQACPSRPQKLGWGYGAELLDPDGYRLQLWDERSMREKG